MRSRRPVNHTSPRRAAEADAYAELRRSVIGRPCQVCAPMLTAAANLGITISLRCAGAATEPHHLRKLSSSGARTNPANVVPACNPGNLAIEHWPDVAKAAGLVVRPEHGERWEALGARRWRDHLRDLPDTPPAATDDGRVPPLRSTGPDPF